MTGPTRPGSRRLLAAVAGWFTPRSTVVMAALVVAWCALWESFSVANVLSGSLVVVPAVGLTGSRHDGRRLRFGAMVRLAGIVALDLVRSTFHVVWEILTPTDYTDEAIIAIDPPVDARSHLLLLVVAITVTPGTAVIETDEETGRLYLHLLHADAAAEVTAHVHRVAELACQAFPVTTPPSTRAVAS